MVGAGPAGRRGASSTGCLFSLLLFVGLLYYGVNIGEVWFRYYRMIDELKGQARLAAGLDDATIRRRLQAAAGEIGLPDEAVQNIAVRRTASPREIRMETKYSETINLPLFHYTFHFNPKAHQPL